MPTNIFKRLSSAVRLALASLVILPSAPAIAAASNTDAKAEKRAPNRLAGAPSPYLRQHAYNPVDWYPWGEEAFAKARRENKPILLSVGYATCHWCHVMERESYSDAEIAKLLNSGFVSIKVDRERLPEVDEIYILATQLLTGQSGGWPNNVLLTPDLLPFYGGTYFPRDAYEGVLREVALQWQLNQAAIVQEGRRIGGMVDQVMKHRAEAADVTPDVLATAVTKTTEDHDTTHAGIGLDAKFPRESLLLFLLDQAERRGNTEARNVALETLDAIIAGGLHDHAGGGFHRYTVDRAWQIPHFEKMLYTQAGVARALIQAHRITGAPRYERAIRRLFAFVLSDLRSPTGGFYAAFDADSEGGASETGEGLFYVWKDDELDIPLSADDAAFARTAFGITKTGNFEGRNTLHLDGGIASAAKRAGMTPCTFARRLDSVLAKLQEHRRTTRKAPSRDNKVLTSWNGAMIAALAEGAMAFNEPRWASAAENAATFFWNEMGASSGNLKRQHFDGEATLVATQQGHALMALAYLTLYDATSNDAWLTRAKSLAQVMEKKFRDTATNDYFMTVSGGFYRPKVSADGDLPAGNAAAIDLFARLARRDLDPEHQARAEAILAAVSGNAIEEPTSHAYTLRAADQLLSGETGPHQFAARGRVRTTARADTTQTATITISVAKGWHINAHKPLEDAFIPTVIAPTSTKISAPEVTYPTPKVQKLKFNDAPLALYEGQISVAIKAPDGSALPHKLALTVQACSTRICLEPETVVLPVLGRLTKE
ncbi:MAG: DUF255 domain-containing protein [Pseudomonadota bacterium]